MPAKSDTPFVTYGEEESAFYFDHIHRVEPFERNNHYHSTYEIYYLISGERHYFIKEKLYLISPGNLVLINKLDIHKSIISGSSEHERVVINFSDAFPGPHSSHLIQGMFGDGQPIIPLQPAEQAQVMQILSKMSQEITAQKEEFESYIQLLLSELLLLTRRFKQHSQSQMAYPDNPLHHKVTDIVKYIHQHYSEKITLDLLSQHFYISPYYLSHIFKEITGFTIISYVNLTRIREAQRLLTETRMKIIDIAAVTGFESLTHFDRTFKKTLNMTASRYRKLYQWPETK
ncbi:helix-turn-helix transcriptional regulator [Paenibacillus lemnae]|uniref:AraC family transcriptional regulator n=1 Tax=Paenibacillus lemnae TaxID=1330551 RepID=A0A848M7N3_PAELE|nr:AraC family transcriptional regulator [Paenibacillus lemnae]NMO96221.1 AraC family transcriptional regulator [Paenibacillus lemnae]